MRRLVVASLFIASVVSAQSVTTDPVGFVALSLLANSDTLVNPPFTRPPEYVGGIASAAGSTITVSGTPWTANQFVYVAGTQPKQYYVLISSATTANPKEGHIYAVTANSTNTLTLDTTQDDLTGIPANAQMLVIPYWTPATIFPAGDANVSFTPTTLSTSYKTQVLIPNYAASGINLPFGTVYFFSNNVDGTSSNIGWRVVGDNTTSHDDDPLLPNGSMTVRNQNGALTGSLTTLGGVLTKKLAIGLKTSLNQQQDNAVSMVRPVDVTLNDTGLASALNFSAATAAPQKLRGAAPVSQDQLLLFNNAKVGFNKPPSAIYVYSQPGGWRLLDDTQTDHGNDLIPAGSGLIVRKGATETGQTVFWTNSPTY